MTADIDYLRTAYRYALPPELIAQYPAHPRDHSRLLVYHQAEDRVEHHYFYELPQLLAPDTLLVMNNSKVFPARLFGRRETLGRGRAEMLLLSLQPVALNPVPLYPVLLKSSRAKKVGDVFSFPVEEDGTIAPAWRDQVLRVEIRTINDDGSFGVSFSRPPETWIEQWGKIPLPAYIRQGRAEASDTSSYQTIYADEQEKGSVAAPTAGLHFTPQVLNDLKKRGIQTSFVTLHVGPGTFVPVKCDDIRQHQMHTEYFTMPSPTAQLWQTARQRQQPVVAVGTTTLRTMQAMLDENGQLKVPEVGRLRSTNIFLYPGKKIYGIKGLLTNFHLPESTLLMLVSALLGRAKTLALYALAVKEKYRFFSYGDAMLILLKDENDRN